MELIDELEELEIDEESITIYCDFPEFSNMQKKLEELNLDIQNSELKDSFEHKKNIRRRSGEGYKIIGFVRRK